ncbi:MAG: phage tail tube protein [Pseudomonadota bacterium]
MANPVYTQGCQIYLEDASQADTYRPLSGVTDFQPISAGAELRDVTELVDTVRQFAGGLTDFGEMAGTINFDPEDADHIRLFNGLGSTFKVIVGFESMTTPQYMAAEGVFRGLNVSMPQNDNVSAAISFKLSGTPTWGTVAPTPPT